MLHIRGSAPSWRRSSTRNEELDSALAAGLWGAAALPVDSRIKSYSQRRNTIIQAEGEQLRLRNTDEGRRAENQLLKETVFLSKPGPPSLVGRCGGIRKQLCKLTSHTSD